MNIEMTIDGVAMSVVGLGDISGTFIEILYVETATKKMNLGNVTWDSNDNPQLEVIKEVGDVTKIDGIAL